MGRRQDRRPGGGSRPRRCGRLDPGQVTLRRQPARRRRRGTRTRPDRGPEEAGLRQPFEDPRAGRPPERLQEGLRIRRQRPQEPHPAGRAQGRDRRRVPRFGREGATALVQGLRRLREGRRRHGPFRGDGRVGPGQGQGGARRLQQGEEGLRGRPHRPQQARQRIQRRVHGEEGQPAAPPGEGLPRPGQGHGHGRAGQARQRPQAAQRGRREPPHRHQGGPGRRPAQALVHRAARRRPRLPGPRHHPPARRRRQGHGRHRQLRPRAQPDGPLQPHPPRRVPHQPELDGRGPGHHGQRPVGRRQADARRLHEGPVRRRRQAPPRTHRLQGPGLAEEGRLRRPAPRRRQGPEGARTGGRFPDGTHNTADGDRNGAGDPVDLATGRMFLPQTDIELPGILPLVFTRRTESGCPVGRFLGPARRPRSTSGWRSTRPASSTSPPKAS